MNELVKFQEPRLPYHPVIEERFNVSRTQWKALVEAVYPAAKTPDAVVMALAYCQARNLDPFKRPVHIVPVWDSNKGAMVETVWPGISELRTTAMRTKQYAGCDEVEFGPMCDEHFEWTDKQKVKREADVAYPDWARMTIYRVMSGSGVRVAIVGPKVYWKETYATQGKSDAPNEMWRKRPRGQLEKCAEAAALRRAFPEELGDEASAEEMEGREVPHAVTSVDAPRLTSGFGKPKEAAVAASDDPAANVGLEGADAASDLPEGLADGSMAQEAEFEDTGSEQVGETVAEATRETDQPDPAEPEDAEEPKTTAQPGEVYLMAGDPIGDDGKRATYKNGQPFSRVSEKGAARLNVHDFHAVEVVEEIARPTETESAQPATSGQATSASAKPASSASAAASSGQADRTQASDTVDPMVAIITKIGEAPAYDVGRKLLAEFCITEPYLKADAMSKSLVKGALWDRYCELDVQGVDVPQVMSQIGLMQLWLEFGAKSKAEIDERWQAFFRLEAYKNANEGQKANISKLMMDRKAVLP